MSNDNITVKVRERSGCLTIIVWVVVCYFIYRAIEVWLPHIYSTIEIYSYNTLNPVWYIFLAATILCTVISTIFKTFGTNGFTTFLKGLFFLVASAASMIFCVWLIFNIAGLGNTHYITKAVMDSKYISKEDINEESNGEWVLKVQDFIKEKQDEEKNKPEEKKTLFDTIYTFINNEIDAAPELIGILIQILLIIATIIICVLIIFLWFTIDILPLILVPISGLLLVLLIDVITRAILSSIEEKILVNQLINNTAPKNLDVNSQQATAGKTYNGWSEQAADVNIVIDPIYSEEQLQAELNHMANAELYGEEIQKDAEIQY